MSGNAFLESVQGSHPSWNTPTSVPNNQNCPYILKLLKVKKSKEFEKIDKVLDDITKNWKIGHAFTKYQGAKTLCLMWDTSIQETSRKVWKVLKVFDKK